MLWTRLCEWIGASAWRSLIATWLLIGAVAVTISLLSDRRPVNRPMWQEELRAEYGTHPHP